MSLDHLPRAPAAERNREAILERLRTVFRRSEHVLEIGSGTGQHAVYFAPRLKHLRWQPSDVEQALPGINAWVEARPATNLFPALSLDVTRVPWPVDSVDAIFSANTAHIMSWAALCAMFSGAGQVLVRNGIFALYGPFLLAGRRVESNERFDDSLRRQHPAMGVRRLDDLKALGGFFGLNLRETCPMPSNNHLLVWECRVGGAFRSVAT